MTESIRQESHIAEKGDICPKCGTKDSIIHQKENGTQRTLTDEKIKTWNSVLPHCCRCGAKFSKGTLFRKVR